MKYNIYLCTDSLRCTWIIIYIIPDCIGCTLYKEDNIYSCTDCIGWHGVYYTFKYWLCWVYMKYKFYVHDIYLCTDCIGCTWSIIYIHVRIVSGVHGAYYISMYRLYWVYMEYSIYLCTDCTGFTTVQCSWSIRYIWVQIVLGVHEV